MAHRKNIEHRLEQDINTWSDVNLTLLSSTNTSYSWQLTVDATDYEINYNDLGYITLSSLPKNENSASEIREIYHGDNSEQSYQHMIDILSDNLLDHWI